MGLQDELAPTLRFCETARSGLFGGQASPVTRNSLPAFASAASVNWKNVNKAFRWPIY